MGAVIEGVDPRPARLERPGDVAVDRGEIGLREEAPADARLVGDDDRLEARVPKRFHGREGEGVDPDLLDPEG